MKGTKTATTDIKIRNVPTDVLHRLDTQAKNGSFKSRQEYLLTQLTELSLGELRLEIEQQWTQLFKEMRRTLENNTEALHKVDELYEIILETD